MKRYNITANLDIGPMQPVPARIVINEADNGEWVRYEDALTLIHVARDERDEAIEERNMLESQAGQMIYRGNSVEHWYAKAMAYKKIAGWRTGRH